MKCWSELKSGVPATYRAIGAWDTQLQRIAQSYGGEPVSLADNPVWQRLIRVRNSLRTMLRSLSLENEEEGDRISGGEGGDQRRMRRAMERIRCVKIICAGSDTKLQLVYFIRGGQQDSYYEFWVHRENRQIFYQWCWLDTISHNYCNFLRWIVHLPIARVARSQPVMSQLRTPWVAIVSAVAHVNAEAAVAASVETFRRTYWTSLLLSDY